MAGQSFYGVHYCVALDVDRPRGLAPECATPSIMSSCVAAAGYAHTHHCSKILLPVQLAACRVSDSKGALRGHGPLTWCMPCEVGGTSPAGTLRGAFHPHLGPNPSFSLGCGVREHQKATVTGDCVVGLSRSAILDRTRVAPFLTRAPLIGLPRYRGQRT